MLGDVEEVAAIVEVDDDDDEEDDMEVMDVMEFEGEPDEDEKDDSEGNDDDTDDDEIDDNVVDGVDEKVEVEEEEEDNFDVVDDKVVLSIISTSLSVSPFSSAILCGNCCLVVCLLVPVPKPLCGFPDSGVGGSRRVPRSIVESIRGRPRPVESTRGLVASKLSPRDMGGVMIADWSNDRPRGRWSSGFMLISLLQIDE